MTNMIIIVIIIMMWMMTPHSCRCHHSALCYSAIVLHIKYPYQGTVMYYTIIFFSLSD